MKRTCGRAQVVPGHHFFPLAGVPSYTSAYAAGKSVDKAPGGPLPYLRSAISGVGPAQLAAKALCEEKAFPATTYHACK